MRKAGMAWQARLIDARANLFGFASMRVFQFGLVENYFIDHVRRTFVPDWIILDEPDGGHRTRTGVCAAPPKRAAREFETNVKFRRLHGHAQSFGQFRFKSRASNLLSSKR
ncbi:hypothetical protein [Paraburkholderia tuberum]|uniref:hypothetical protein n=1 Tax=Paraburkholderia tuberum TaxID=157910 RepID=UPI0014288D10|nr:hypothetical protein [Paraburkholderia tuberum]